MISEKLIGKQVEIHFKDHCEDHKSLFDTELNGKLLEVHEDRLVVICWDVLNEERDIRIDNWKIFTIDIRTIETIHYYTTRKKVKI